MIIWRSSCRACRSQLRPSRSQLRQPVANSGSDGIGSWSGIKKAEALPLLAPGTTRAPGPRLRERSCRVAVKEVDVIHSCPATVAASGAGVKSNRLASGRPPSRPTNPSVNVDLRMPAAGVSAHPLEGMTNEREARFLGRTSLKAGLIALPSGMIVGSGTPGPEDEWKMPLRRLMRLSLRRSDPLSRPGSDFGCPQACLLYTSDAADEEDSV